MMSSSASAKAKQKTQTSSTAAYGLRNTRERNIVDMLSGQSPSSRESPGSSKRTLGSPPKRKVTDKVFITPNEDELGRLRGTPKANYVSATTNTNPDEETRTPCGETTSTEPPLPDQTNNFEQSEQASEPEQNEPPDNYKLTQEKPTETQSQPLDHPTPTDLQKPRQSLIDKVKNLAKIIAEIKIAQDNNTETPDVRCLVEKAYSLCVENNFLGDTTTLLTIEQARSSASKDTICETMKLRWPAEAYKITDIIKDDKENDLENIVVVFVKRGQADQPLHASLIGRIPALKRVNTDSPTMTKITCTETIGTNTNSRTTYYVTLDEDGTDIAFYDNLYSLKDQILTNDGDVTLVNTTGHPSALRKACELALHDAGKRFSILIEGRPLSKKQNPKTETITIAPGSMSYADLLKSVKENVHGDELGVRILKATKTSAGELEMKVQGSAKTITDVINTRVPAAKTSLKKTIKTMHIRDLEEDVTESEIMTGLVNALPVDLRTNYTVKSIRPAYNNTSRATIQLPSDAANFLHTRGFLQVGLVSARIRLRVETQTCSRCWGEGHSPRECKGEDKRDRCFNCREKGHQKSQCPQAKTRPGQEMKNQNE